MEMDRVGGAEISVLSFEPSASLATMLTSFVTPPLIRKIPWTARFNSSPNPNQHLEAGGLNRCPISLSSESGPALSTTPSAELLSLPPPTSSNAPIATACAPLPAVSSPTLNAASTTSATAPTTGHLFYPSLPQFSAPSLPCSPLLGSKLA